MRILPTLIKIVLLISLSAWFTACGGGGGDANTAPLLITGEFLDSAVEGLTYQSGSNPSGTTDANGTFTYTPGETLTFSVGGVVLGTLPDGASVITPFDFGVAATVNIARFLQTLDADGDPSNGIDLTAAAVALVDTTLSDSVFLSDAATFETDIGPVLEIALGPGALLLDEATALAHLVSEVASPFEVAELAGHGFVAVFPEINEIGVMSFASSTVATMWHSNTLSSGGDGAITVKDWSVDANGTLRLTDPVDLTTVTIGKVDSSSHASSLIMTEEPGAVPILGTLLVPVTETVLSLAGESGRTYDVVEDGNSSQVNRITFLPDGTLSRVENGNQYNETWEIDPNGILVTILESDADVVRILVMLNGSFATGGNILSIDATNLSGYPTALELQLDAMHEGTLMPLISTNPDGTIPYSFSTGKHYSGGCNNDESLYCEIYNFFGDMSVSGTFDYDPGATSGAIYYGPTDYPGSITNLVGSVNGIPFSDPNGVTTVQNDGFDLKGEFTDFLMVHVTPEDLVGFEVIGLRLSNVRLIWIEGSTTESDFLSNNDLPALLPGIEGRLAFDFVRTTNQTPGEEAYTFFQGLTVSPLTQNPNP